MTTHEEHKERISAFIDGQLDTAEEASVFQHLSGCDDCRRFLRSTIDLRGRLAAVRSVRSVAAAKFRPSGRKVDPLVLAWQKRVPLPVAASVALLIMLGSLVASSGMFTPDDEQKVLTRSPLSSALNIHSPLP